MKLSIIIPTYNRSKYIFKCVDSVLSQTYKNIEVVVIDDGSTDNTEEIIKSFNDKRVKYFKNDNHGIGYSRNFGLNKATGDYIFFLDSDDYINGDTVDIIFKNIKNNDILVFDYKEIFEKDNKEKINKIPVFNDYILVDHPELINMVNLGPCNKVYKRSLLIENNIKFPEDIKYEDALFVIKSIENAKSISSCGLALTNVVVHKGNETLTVDKRVFDIFKVLDLIKKELSSTIYEDELNKLIVRKITTYTVSQRTQANKKTAKRFIDEAFRYLKLNVPDYKNNKYYKDRSFIKRSIEKNKALTKIYCKLYKLIKIK